MGISRHRCLASWVCRRRRERDRRLPQGRLEASGLEYVGWRLGVEAAGVPAICDGRHELVLFECAGLSVAVGQAIEQILEGADAVTDAVTDSVQDNGAAVEIERWFG